MDPEKIQKYFYLSQIFIGVTFASIAWLSFRPKTSSSRFKIREADLPKASRPADPNAPRLEDARIQVKGFEEERRKKKGPVLALPGIRTQGTPYEVLGVTPDATDAEILKAYRDLMKRYHPDKVAPAGTPAWNEAQKIAEVINQAKESLIQKKKS